jgi:hypothetical protein
MDKIIFFVFLLGTAYAKERPSKHEAGGVDPSRSAKTRYEYNEKKITARILDSSESKDIESAVQDLVTELSVLEGEFQKAELSYKNSSEADAYFEILWANKQNQALQDLIVAVDDIVLYESRPGTVITLEKFPLFQGSLPPGKHNISLTAKVAPASHGSLAQSGVFAVTHSETLDVPTGKVRKQLTISADDPKANKVSMRSEAL